jgi:hypothetical protein
MNIVGDDDFNTALEALAQQVAKMPESEAEARLEELRDRLVPNVPLRDGETPEAHDLMEFHEYALLKKRFGYS